MIFDAVEAQLAAYNGRDLAAFMRCFQEDCAVDDAEGNRLLSGHAEMRARYRALFDASPNLHCVVVQRTRIGDYIIDEEEITGRVPELRRAVVIYRIERAGGLISHVRFLRDHEPA